jgi:Transposase DDE domain
LKKRPKAAIIGVAEKPEMEPMVKVKFRARQREYKRLNAQEVHRLVSEVLQEQFPLAMDGCAYETQDIWDVLIAAAVERLTIEGASEALENASSPNTVRNVLRGLLPDSGMESLEGRLNELVVARLPPNLLRGILPCAIDVTEIAYHGRHEETDEAIRRSKAKSGTTHFHCYATLYTVKRGKRYTLALMLVKRSDTSLSILQRLLKRGEELGLRIERLYLDRGFDNNGVIAFLKTQPFPAIIPLTIRGQTGGSRALLKGRHSSRTRYTRASQTYGEQTFTVYIVCKYSAGRYKRQGIERFAYILTGNIVLPPHQIYEEYRHRFAIESSYRLMNQVRARTTSASVALRLFFVALAFLLLNLWNSVKASAYALWPFKKWHFPLACWRLWLWEVVKQRLGFVLDLPVVVYL